MHTAELKFRRLSRDADPDAAVKAILELVHRLPRNGQLAEVDAPMAQVRGGYRLFASPPAADSLSPKHHSKDVRRAIRELRKAGIAWESTDVIGPDPESDPVCTCRKPAALILETDFLSSEEPLRCGDCGGVRPLYTTPPTTEYNDVKYDSYENIRFWQYRYHAFDAIWIHSGAGERLGYRQLSKHDSELNAEGRDLCRLIEQASGVPTYYALYRYYGRSLKAERKRKCPFCGGNWLLNEPWLDRFEFRCDACRLVSYFACDVT